MENSGSQTGTLKCAIDDVDESSGHIQLTVTSFSGSISGPPKGTVLYMTFEFFNGNSLYYDWSDTDYPASGYHGPYTR